MSSLLRHLLLIATVITHGTLGAQVPPGWDAREFQMSREELVNLLTRYESVIQSPGYSEALKEDARQSAELIRSRLEEGDFKVGDRIVLEVEGEEDILPDTLLVEEGPQINPPNMAPISLRGILRSELEDHLARELARFIRDPEVDAQSLIRMSVQGAVGRPGFYVFPSEMLLGDVLMEAGGPAQNADLEELRIRRGPRTLMEGSEVQTALDDGRSLDQLGLQAGDELTVPEEPDRSFWPQVLRYGILISSSLFLGIRIF